MKNIKLISALLISFGLISCATTQRQGSQKNEPAVNQFTKDEILVISGFNQTFHMKVIGTTAFTNRYKEIEGYDLNTNELIRSAFEGKPGYEVYNGDIDFDFSHGGRFTRLGFNKKKARKDLSKLKSTYKNKKVLLIGPENHYDNVYMTNQLFNGFGITRRYLFSSPDTVLHVAMKMALVDLETLKFDKWEATVYIKPVNAFPEQKLHKLDSDQFNELSNQFPRLFYGAIKELLKRF